MFNILFAFVLQCITVFLALFLCNVLGWGRCFEFYSFDDICRTFCFVGCFQFKSVFFVCLCIVHGFLK